MKTVLSIQELGAIISDFMQIGFMEAVKSYEPTRDIIRENELRGWCKMLGIDYTKVKKLVKSGLIHSRRNGEGQNSPIIYSKKEVKSALAIAGLNGIIKTSCL